MNAEELYTLLREREERSGANNYLNGVQTNASVLPTDLSQLPTTEADKRNVLNTVGYAGALRPVDAEFMLPGDVTGTQQLQAIAPEMNPLRAALPTNKAGLKTFGDLQSLLGTLSAAKTPNAVVENIIGGAIPQFAEESAYSKAYNAQKGKQDAESAMGGGESDDILAKKIANHEVELSPTFFRSARGLALAKRAAEINPNFDTGLYKARAATRRDFYAGKTADNITRMNTAIDHLSTLREAGEKLQNAGPTFWNYVANKGLSAIGDERVSEFETAVNTVAAELAAVYKGSGAPTTVEIREWKDNISSSKSPEQLAATIRSAAKLLGGRLGAVENRYREATGTDYINREGTKGLLSPEARESYENLRNYKAGNKTATSERRRMKSKSGRMMIEVAPGQWEYEG